MKKMLFALLMSAGIAAFAGKFDGSNDTALTESLISEAKQLNDDQLLNFADMLLAADLPLSVLSPEALRAAFSGKTPADVEALAREKAPGEYEIVTFLESRYSPEARRRIAAGLRKVLTTAKAKSPAGFIDDFTTATARLGAAEYRRLMREIADGVSDDKIVEFYIAYTLTGDDDTLKPIDRAKLYFMPGGAERAIEYAKTHYSDYPVIMKKADLLIAEKGRPALVAATRERLAAELADPPEPAEVPWVTDFTAAQKRAAAENKKLFVLFTGSDWCPWCIKLTNQLLATREFVNFAEPRFVMVMVDFPNQPLPPEQAAADQKLGEKYGISGYPTILIMRPDGTVTGQAGYEDVSVKNYIDMIKEISEKTK
ncbi:MAG: thioredoxin family protein [Victivallaceae bacterium]|nr:thioredoxin family protein [Victivallaceae bacterium]